VRIEIRRLLHPRFNLLAVEARVPDLFGLGEVQVCEETIVDVRQLSRLAVRFGRIPLDVALESNLLRDQFREIANRDLVLNVMNWLTSDEDLISIRPVEPEDRRLRVTGSAMRVIFLVSVILIPLAVILSGVSVWWKRR